MITIIILLALLTQPLTATWERPGVARIAHDAGCLWRNDTFIACYDRAGVLRMGGKGPLDHAYRPAAGDVYRLVRPDGSVEQARLTSVVYLPIWRA